jgi:tripartite-type tricarboxylate transporter receptor subunit TctC
LAIASPARSSALPGIPTVTEAVNLANFEITAWQGIVVPTGTPMSIITKLNKAANASLQQKEFREKLLASGAEPYGSSPEEYGAYLRSEQRRWKDVIQRANIQIQ